MKQLFLSLLCCLVATLCWAETGTALTKMPGRLNLDDALALAQKYNPALHRARLGIISKNAAIREVRAAILPSLDATGNYTRFDEKRLQIFNPETQPEDTTWSTKIEASTPVFSGGRSRYAIKSAKDKKEAAIADVITLEQELAVLVQETYLAGVLAKAAAAAQQEEINLLKEQFQRAEKRYDAGVGSRFEMLQAEVALANAQPAKVRETNNYRRQVDRLSRLLGLPLVSTQEAGEIELVLPAPPKTLKTQMQEALAIALKQRPEIDSLLRSIEAEESALEVEARGKWPLVELFGNYGVQSDQFGGDNLEGWTAGLRLNWSLIDGGGRRAKVAKAEAQLDSLAQQKKELLLEISGEVRESLYDYEEAWEILESTGKVIEQGEEALRMARDRHESGKGTQLDVFESQTQLTRARLSRLQAENSCHLAAASLRRALGE